MAPDWKQLRQWAEAEVDDTLAELPEPLRAKAVRLPVTFQRAPGRAFQEDGIEPDTLGLFVGGDYCDHESAATPIPPQIILFLGNLWDLAESDPASFREEVRTTLLHELGHYLGLDEDGLTERGLE